MRSHKLYPQTLEKGGRETTSGNGGGTPEERARRKIDELLKAAAQDGRSRTGMGSIFEPPGALPCGNILWIPEVPIAFFSRPTGRGRHRSPPQWENLKCITE